jgi:repressor LexA
MGDDAELEPLDPPQDQRRIPILGAIPCGVPVREITDIEGYIYYDPPRPTAAEFVALRAKGPSMEPEIRDGSVVVIRVTESCDPGDICAVSVNGEDVTCKIVKPDADGGVWLIPINPAFDPIHYSAQEINDLPVRIIGTVEEVRYTPRKRQ